MNNENHDPYTEPVLAMRKQLFNQFCQTLEDEKIRYVILSGYQGYPDHIDSDVDFMVSESDFAKLPLIFKDAQVNFGAPLIQFFRHETTACYYILANQIGGHIAYLHPDAAASYRRKGRLWLNSEKVLQTRQKTEAGFWVPSAAVEFEYYFVKRIDKQQVESQHLVRLANLFSSDPGACHTVIASLVPEKQVEEIITAIKTQNIAWFYNQRDELKSMLSNIDDQEPIYERIKNKFADLLRKLSRLLYPTGLVVAVLGPDGSGKTTVIQHLESEFAPAFRKQKRFHLRPHFDKQGSGSVVHNPHSAPPRNNLAGLAKLILFVTDYWWGYFRVIYPAKVRSTLVIFDRHFYDMLVDPIRYRMQHDFLPVKFFSKLIPQPDIWLVLDAPAELLVSRKGELDLNSAKMLSNRYKTLLQGLPNAYLVNTSGTLEETHKNAISPILALLAKRSVLRLGEEMI